jgi:ubiquitin-like protein ATG12
MDISMATSTKSSTDINEIDANILHDKDIAIENIVSSTASASIATGTTTITQDHEQQPNDVTSNIPDKVKIHFVAVGSAPILKRTKFQINSDQRFAAVHVFLRKLLKISSSDDNHTNSNENAGNPGSNRNNLFLYCCSAFVPSPDHLIGELRDSFANAHTKELVIQYSLQEAWG